MSDYLGSQSKAQRTSKVMQSSLMTHCVTAAWPPVKDIKAVSLLKKTDVTSEDNGVIEQARP